MTECRNLIDLFPEEGDNVPPPRKPRRTKCSPIEQYHLECHYCSLGAEWESDIWSYTAGVRELRAQGWRQKNKRWVCPECASVYCQGKGLWGCGVCGTVKEGQWGLRPVISPDGWRHIACPDCRHQHPELQICPDGQMWANYPPPVTSDDQGLPFGLDEWLAGG